MICAARRAAFKAATKGLNARDCAKVLSFLDRGVDYRGCKKSDLEACFANAACLLSGAQLRYAVKRMMERP